MQSPVVSPQQPSPCPSPQVTRGNVGQLSPATEGGGLLNPYELPATHDHNLNLYLASYGSTDERERRALHPG